MNRRRRRGRIGAKAALGILAGVMLFTASLPAWGANVVVSDGTKAYTYSATGASPTADGTTEIVLDPGTGTNTLTVDGTGTTITGGATVNGGATINGGANITGGTTTDTLTATGGANLVGGGGNGLTVGATGTTVNGALKVTGTATTNGINNNNGNISTGNLSATGSATIGSLGVTGGANITGGTTTDTLNVNTGSGQSLTVDGNGTTVTGGITTDGLFTTGIVSAGALNVTGQGGANVTGDVKVGNNLDVTGAANLSGGANITGGATTDTLTTTGLAQLKGGASISTGPLGSYLSVDTSGTTIDGGAGHVVTVKSTGTTITGGSGNFLTVDDTGTTVTGSATVTGDTTINGLAQLKNGANIDFGATITGASGNSLKVDNTGGTTIDSGTGQTLTVNGTGTTVTGGVAVTGGTKTDTLHATGGAVVDGMTYLNNGASIYGGNNLLSVGSAGTVITSAGGGSLRVDGTGTTVTGAANLTGGANSGTIHINDATSGADNVSGIKVLTTNAIQTFTASLNGELDVAGVANLNGGANSGSIHINDATSGANNVSGINSLSAATVNTSNIATNNISTGTLSTTGDASVGGNLDVNGNLRVTGQTGGSILGAGTASSSLIIMNKGETGSHASISGTGAITMTSGGATADQAVTSLTLTNGLGNTHGLVVTEKETTLSGGTHSTNLALNDAGAAFQSSAGGPVKVTGVADGSGDYDAVNYRQLKKAYSGVASVAALAAIPAPAPGKRFTLGLGVGNYMSQSAMAIGFKASITDNISFAAGAGLSNEQVTSNAGIGFSW